MVYVAPSLLAADFSRMKEEIDSVSAADWLHVDVMDGHFVPNLSFGPDQAAAIAKVSDCPCDVHLMISRPQDYLERFADAADILCFHAESDCEIGECIDRIRALGKRPGLAIKPGTPAETVFPYLDKLFLVLVMTVEPGFGGQKCREECFEKVRTVRQEADRRGIGIHIEVDGGIGAENAPRVIAAGADILVAGSSVFKAADRNAAIRQMKGEN